MEKFGQQNNLSEEQLEQRRNFAESSLSETIEKLLSSMDSKKADEIIEFEKYFNKNNKDNKNFRDYFLGKILFSTSPENLPSADEASELHFDTDNHEIESFIKNLTENSDK